MTGPVTVVVQLPTRVSGQDLAKAINETHDSGSILAAARQHGVISHRFVANSTGALVIDQWPSEQAFNAFYREQETAIRAMLGPVMQDEPSIQIYENLNTTDRLSESLTQ